MATDLSIARTILGCLGAGLVDAETGFLLASEGGEELDLEVAAAGHAMLLRQALGAGAEALGGGSVDQPAPVDDILLTLGRQVHMIRPLATSYPTFLFLALDRQAANLGMARLQAKRIAAGIEL